MTKPIGYFTGHPVVTQLAEQYGAWFETLSQGDKSVIVAVIGMYFHGKTETIEEYEDSEPWTELIDGWNEYPLMCSDHAEEIIYKLNQCDDKALLGVVMALAQVIEAGV